MHLTSKARRHNYYITEAHQPHGHTDQSKDLQAFRNRSRESGEIRVDGEERGATLPPFSERAAPDEEAGGQDKKTTEEDAGAIWRRSMLATEFCGLVCSSLLPSHFPYSVRPIPLPDPIAI
jgi:hypothetical protein